MNVKGKPRQNRLDKLKKPQEPRLVDTPPKMQKQFGVGKMLIPTPVLVGKLIRKIPSGRLISVNILRERLAKDHNANSTCPLTTGIFIRIVAEAAEEHRHLGEKEIAPYWRVVKNGGILNEKYPGGVQAQAAYLEKEGHTIVFGSGKKPPKVKDFENYLIKL